MPNTETTQNHAFGDAEWLDIQNISDPKIQDLVDTRGLHRLHIEECLQERQLTQIEIEDDYIFVLLHFPYYLPTRDQILTDRLGIFVGRDFLITVHADATSVVSEAFKAITQHANTTTTSAQVLNALIAQLQANTTSLVQAVQQELDAIEEKVFDNTDSDVLQIGKLRQKIVRLKRVVALEQPVLGELAENIRKFGDEDAQRQLKQKAKQAHKLLGNIEEARETIEIFKDADFITSTEKTNQILAVLTIIFTLAIPSTVIAGFYGMNVNLPGGIQVGAWRFLGTYTTLILLLLASILPALFMYSYFRRRKWL